MVRLAILDHTEHRLYVEDVADSVIEQYGGEEEYINDMYNMEDYSWEYITDALYLAPQEDPVEVKFEEMINL